MISEKVVVLRCAAEMLEEDGHMVYSLLMKAAANIIEEQAEKLHALNMERSAAYYNGGWIPCEERLPDNANHPGAFCPRYMVMTKWGVTEGWYNPDRESWYILGWFMDRSFKIECIDLERGTFPETIRIPNTSEGIVTHWMPLPEPYKEGTND